MKHIMELAGNGDTNDISFNVTDLSNNRYYKYYYTITNTLCKTGNFWS